MPAHVPKRVYTASALEGWFSQLAADWEKFFPPHPLSLGQQLYLEGAVTSVELQKGHAIFHGRIEGKDLYALVEWEGAEPHIRSSSSDTLLGQALAVAGLYEAEELVVESISPLPPEGPEDKKPSPSRGLFAEDKKPLLPSSGAHPLLRPGGHASAPRPAPPAPKPCRTLCLQLDVTSAGLVIDAAWEDAQGQQEPALKFYRRAAAAVSEPERERLIRLTALARKSGFELEGTHHDYLLTDFARMPDFFATDIEVWRKYFRVAATPQALALGRGVQTITVEVEARGQGNDLSFHWLFLLGGTELTRAQIKTVLQAGRQPALVPALGLVRLSEDQADVLADWADTILSPNGTCPRYMLFSLFRQDALPIRMSRELEAWSRSLMDEPPALAHLPDFLRDYQRKGVAWLGHLLDHQCHPLLADEMGLGKTLQLLSLLHSRFTSAPPSAPSLIVAPASVVPVWQAEAARHFPTWSAQVATAESLPAATTPGLWFISYGQLKRLQDKLQAIPFHTVVLDEAQMIKNPKTQAARACYALQAQHRLALTGTPVENRPMDLWSIFRFLMPGLLGGAARFEDLSQTDAQRLIQRVHQQVSPFILRRTKAEVARELPEKIEAVLTAPLSPTQQAHYQQLVTQGLQRFGNDLRQASRQRGLGFFTLLTRLRQVSCHAGLLPWVQCPPADSGKVTLLLEQLEDILSAGSKVVIFSQFVGFLRTLQQAVGQCFPGVPQFTLTGATVDRQKPVNEFQSASGSAVMFVSLRAGGTGITLHAADYLFLMDPWWNPAVEDQAIDRVHRLGQKKTVFVYRVVSAGTVEARIQDLKATKRDLFNNLIGHLRDNTHFALYFRSIQDLISLSPKDDEAE